VNFDSDVVRKKLAVLRVIAAGWKAFESYPRFQILIVVRAIRNYQSYGRVGIVEVIFSFFQIKCLEVCSNECLERLQGILKP